MAKQTFLIIVALLTLGIFLNCYETNISGNIRTSSKDEVSMIGSEIFSSLSEQRITGSGFTFEMIAALNQSLHQASSIYGINYPKHAEYISTQLNKILIGRWIIIIVPQLNITKNFTDEVGYTSYASKNIYAFWYGVCAYDKNIAYFVSFLSVEQQSQSAFISTQVTSTANLPAGYSSIIRGFNRQVSLTRQNTIYDYNLEVSNKLRKFDDEKWCVMSVPFYLNKQYPQAYGIISSESEYGAFSGQFTTKSGIKLNQMMYKIQS